MKQLVLLLCQFWMYISVFSQPSSITITKDKTTSLIFPFPILHVDRGTKEILVLPVKEANNILLVKAASRGFPETNLSVITKDGSVYSFRVNFKDDPADLVWHIPEQKKGAIERYASGILDNYRRLKGVRKRKWHMEAMVSGIYVKDDVLYCQLLLYNRSPIDYDIDQLRFYIRDKKTGKRTGMQENELIPLYVAGNNKQVKACGFSMVVVALDKFTIPDAKVFAVQVTERNGGRHMRMAVRNKDILKAIPLPDLR